MLSTLKRLSPFYFWPNNGNLGDLLIAEATRQYFRRHNIQWMEYNPDMPPEDAGINLVYGGGGRFTSHWGGIDKHKEHLTHVRVKQAIILPHSFYDVDWFILSMDERHTLFCREQRSYEYCCSLHPRASIKQANDMGLELRINELPEIENIPIQQPQQSNPEEIKQHELITKGWVSSLAKRVCHSTVNCSLKQRDNKIAFLLRTDKEKNATLFSPLSFDISLAWDSSCRHTAYNPYFIRAFAEALRYPDIVVTDRLHVGIMAYLLEKEVYLLDNDYKKLSSVYAFSLSSSAHVHILPDNTLNSELEIAWNKLNSTTNIILFRCKNIAKWLTRIARKIMNKIGIW